MTGVADVDIQPMRDQVFFEGPERSRRLSRYWLLLVLSAVIASAGVVSDSTATVIGAMIVAPLMAPILGIVLAVVLADGGNLRRCLLLLITGAAVVAGLSWLLGLLVPFSVVAATNGQVAARVTPRVVDLVAALATGAVGSVALARSDISDTLPGVAIAISLVPPLAVVGLTLESGAPRQALGALLLFTTNVVAILASGIVVMALYRAYRPVDQATSPGFHRIGAVAVIACLLLAVIVPLSVNSDRVNKTTIRQSEVQAVAEQWAAGRAGSWPASPPRASRYWSRLPVPAPPPASPGSAAIWTRLAWPASMSAPTWPSTGTSACRGNQPAAAPNAAQGICDPPALLRGHPGKRIAAQSGQSAGRQADHRHIPISG